MRQRLRLYGSHPGGNVQQFLFPEAELVHSESGLLHELVAGNGVPSVFSTSGLERPAISDSKQSLNAGPNSRLAAPRKPAEES